MVSRKSERLVNLTIALLGSKRWLTKTQIFAAIEGYEGEASAMERMFERDKEDLRNLGITIEVGSFDPLFDDEVGYRIQPESYQIDIASLSSPEISLISLATQMWKGAVLDSTALSALVKLSSLGIESDLDAIPAIAPTITISDQNLVAIVDAISEGKVISFHYIATDLTRQSRVLEPYGAGTKGGNWYVSGRDIEKEEVRLFRLDRIDSDVTVQGKSRSFEIPKNFSMSAQLQSPEKSYTATLKLRRDKAYRLRAQATVLKEGEEWTIVAYPYLREPELIADVLWHLDDAMIIKPLSAREAIVAALEELVRNHG